MVCQVIKFKNYYSKNLLVISKIKNKKMSVLSRCFNFIKRLFRPRVAPVNPKAPVNPVPPISP